MKRERKNLYHGSVRKIIGNRLLPRIPQDLEKKPENLHKGVYATTIKEIAITMAIISCKGVNWASLSFNKKPYGKIYEGWPKQKFVYLYTLPSEPFKKSGGSGKQYVSLKPVRPIKVKKLLVKDYIYLVKKEWKR